MQNYTLADRNTDPQTLRSNPFYLSNLFQVIAPTSEKYQKLLRLGYDDHNDYPRQRQREKKGLSGYDPEEPDMRGVFMARGPGIIL